MILEVTMKKDGEPSQVVKIEVVVYQNCEVANLRRLGYKIEKIELTNGGWCTL